MSWLVDALTLRWLRGQTDKIEPLPEGTSDQQPLPGNDPREAAAPTLGGSRPAPAGDLPSRASDGRDLAPSDALAQRAGQSAARPAHSEPTLQESAGVAESAGQPPRAERSAAMSRLLELDAAVAEAFQPAPAAEPARPAAASPGRQASILVVDDQQPNRELLVGYLSNIPCQVREAVDGESALAAVAAAPPDLILLDVMMPGLNGYAVTQRLKTDPRTATIPVVLVTSLQETADRLKGLQAGADEFLTKPVDRAELVTRVRTLLRLKRLRDERQAVGDLGQRALEGIELSVLMDEATRLISDTLRVDYVAVWELLAPGENLMLRAGVGWQDGLVGRTTVGAGADTQMGYSLRSRIPVVVEDLGSESRFSGPSLLHEHEVTSGISTAISGRDRRLGVLSVHTRRPRSFAKDDIFFVESIAQVLATAIMRKRAEAERAQALLREQAARQRLEESNRALERATQAKSEFLAAMSHELRTPLNSIIGFTELLLDDPSEDPGAPRRRHFVTNIKESGRHLLNLVNDILDLAKVEAGRVQLFPASFGVGPSLQAITGALLPLAEKKGLTLTTQVAPEVTTIQADERRFRQVLYNLLSNAVKFTPEGGRVEATARLVDNMVEVVVSDTGIGIAPEDLERLFEPFQQLDSSTLREDGTGLGLALTRRLVELQGGQIRVESAPGQGSRFTFTIPLHVAGQHGAQEFGLDPEGMVVAGLDGAARPDLPLNGIAGFPGGQGTDDEQTLNNKSAGLLSRLSSTAPDATAVRTC